MNKKQKKQECTLCGLCKTVCPIYSVLLKETLSPRGKMILAKSNTATDLLYYCSLCKACEQKCPNNINIAETIRHAREKTVAENKSPETVKKMIANIRKYKNPFGKLQPGKKPKKLYCC